MSNHGGKKALILAVALMVAPLLCPAPVLAQAPAQVASSGGGIRALTDSEQQSAACVTAATGVMGITYAVGPSEMIMIVVGGLLTPSSSSTLFISLMGTMAAASCTLGSLLYPSVKWAWQSSGDAADGLSSLGQRVGREVAGVGERVFGMGARATAEAPLAH